MDARQLSEELNLKAMIALSSIIQDEQRGVISRAQAATGIRGIYDAVSGLVTQDTFDLISLAAADYKHQHGVEVDVLKVGDTIQGTIRFCHSGAVLRIDRATPHRKPSNNVDEVDAAAKQDAKALFHSMRNKVQTQW